MTGSALCTSISRLVVGCIFYASMISQIKFRETRIDELEGRGLEAEMHSGRDRQTLRDLPKRSQNSRMCLFPPLAKSPWFLQSPNWSI
jgi:hypothetical protein